MSDVIKPALTAEEWAKVLPKELMHRHVLADPHKAAAICLYQQPFGFTQADVRMLRRLHRDVRLTHEDMQTGEITEPLESLAARIAALLPPTG
jgi:hypothetical protein